MDAKNTNGFGLNESYVEILRAQWIENPLSVGKEWRDFFENKGTQESTLVEEEEIATKKEEAPAPVVKKTYGEEIPLLGIQKKIADNMEESLQVPTATSVRTIPMKVLLENRLVINQYLTDDARPRCSFTHVIAYALVQALKKFPALNNSYAPGKKIVNRDINLGLAIDIKGKDGGRLLLVPNIKDAGSLDFSAFLMHTMTS